ncbi:hypothetical protein O3P69_010008 [Scylla paramamosain]|uniref:Uncharacterized protein n=1 Tax=Scylla paramamosain TaxID=85552 RepID=A0AAW0SRK2_SCYPA
MKTILKARLTGRDWMDELPWVLLGIRTAPKDYLAMDELVYGVPLTRQLKAFMIDYRGCHETVSVDRLKLAHLDFDRQVQLAQPRYRG